MPWPESKQPSQIDLAHARRAAIEELFDEAIHADHRARLSLINDAPLDTDAKREVIELLRFHVAEPTLSDEGGEAWIRERAQRWIAERNNPRD